MRAHEGRDGVLSVSLTHGFAWGDVTDMGAKLLIYTDAARDPDGNHGRALAQRLADELFALRERLAPQYLGSAGGRIAAVGAFPGSDLVGITSPAPGSGLVGNGFRLRRKALLHY